MAWRGGTGGADDLTAGHVERRRRHPQSVVFYLLVLFNEKKEKTTYVNTYCRGFRTIVDRVVELIKREKKQKKE